MDSPVGKVVVSAVYEGGAAERHGEYGQALPVLGGWCSGYTRCPRRADTHLASDGLKIVQECQVHPVNHQASLRGYLRLCHGART